MKTRAEELGQRNERPAQNSSALIPLPNLPRCSLRDGCASVALVQLLARLDLCFLAGKQRQKNAGILRPGLQFIAGLMHPCISR